MKSNGMLDIAASVRSNCRISLGRANSRPARRPPFEDSQAGMPVSHWFAAGEDGVFDDFTAAENGIFLGGIGAGVGAFSGAVADKAHKKREVLYKAPLP